LFYVIWNICHDDVGNSYVKDVGNNYAKDAGNNYVVVTLTIIYTNLFPHIELTVHCI